MSDFDSDIMREPDGLDNDRARGRIPKSDWAYVLGQSRLAGRTLQAIGDEYNATPSAVHYVVKMAGKLADDNKLTPSLDKPEGEEASAAMQRAISSARKSSEWAMKKVADVQAPKGPSQVELMAQQANAMLEDANCKRLFDATSKIIVTYVAFQAGPEATAKAEFKDSLHELRRAIAGIELKVEMAAVKPAAPTQSAPSTPMPVRTPEVA